MSLKYGKDGSIDTAVLDENGEPTFNPAMGGSWAEELVGSDGVYRYLSGGNASAIKHSYSEATVLTLCRKRTNALYTIAAQFTGTAPAYTLIANHDGVSNIGLYASINATNPQTSNTASSQPNSKQMWDKGWHWCGFAVLNNSMKFWFDGANKGGVSLAHGLTTFVNPTNTFLVGTSTGALFIAATLIYNRVLTDDEVSNIMLGKVKPTSVDGLQGYYKFNETHGTSTGGVCTDYSGAGNHLTYSGAVWASFNPASPTKNSSFPYVLPPLRNQANWWERTPIAIASKDAMGSVFVGAVNIPHNTSASIVSSITLSGWVKLSPSDKQWQFLIKDSGASNYYAAPYKGSIENSGNILRLGRGSSAGNTNASLTLSKPIQMGVWTHVVMSEVTDGDGSGVCSFYVNGVLVGAVNRTATTISDAGQLMFLSSWRKTAMRSFRLFSRAITASEVEELYRTDSIADRTGLVGEWMMNDVSTNFCANTGSAGSALNSNTFTGGKYLDSPYWMPRKKRRGKQLAYNVAAGTYFTNFAGIKAALQAATTWTVSGWFSSSNASRSYVHRQLWVSGHTSRDGIEVSLTGDTMSVATSSSSSTQYLLNQTYGIAPGQWALISCEINWITKTLKRYVNGVLIGTHTISGLSGAVPVFSGDTQIYSNRIGGAAVLVKRDDDRLYNRALTPEEHYQLYLDNAPRNGLLVEYTFDNDVEGTTVIDSSGNNFHGTPTEISAANYVTSY